MVDESVVEEIVNDRQEKYGHPKEHFKRTVMILNALGFRRIDTWNGAADYLQEADWPAIMIADKLARSCNDSLYEDNWNDMAGYAKTRLMLLEK